VEELPHRGGLVLAFGIIGLVMFFMCPLVGLPLGVLAWVWGTKDLKAMDAGEMDPEGRGMTQGGMITGIIGAALNGLAALVFLAYLVFVVVLGFAFIAAK